MTDGGRWKCLAALACSILSGAFWDDNMESSIGGIAIDCRGIQRYFQQAVADIAQFLAKGVVCAKEKSRRALSLGTVQGRLC